MSEKRQKHPSKDYVTLPDIERGKAHSDRHELARQLAHEKQVEEARDAKLRNKGKK